VALLGDGKVRDLPGGVDEYLRLRAAASPASPSRALERTEFRTPAARTTAVAAGPSAAEVRAARKEMGRIERRLDRIGEEEARLHDEMARSAADHQVVIRLDADLRALEREREDLEADWLSAAETAG
jgi:ABC transport system ATP-binding/permease protein